MMSTSAQGSTRARALGELYRKMRGDLHLSQVKVAQAAGCAVSTVCKIETAQMQASQPVIASVGRALGVMPAELEALGYLYAAALLRGAPGDGPPLHEFRAALAMLEAAGFKADLSVSRRANQVIVVLTPPPGTDASCL